MDKESSPRYGRRSYPTVNAIRFIRSMPGGSQSVLVLCDDGCFYVVKMKGNPQGRNTLANELLGNQVITAMGLPCASCAFVRLSPAFVTAMYPCGWFDRKASPPIRPKDGVHLGSRFVGLPDGNSRTSDYIGKARLMSIANRKDFVGMLVVDAWADHQDQRQAVFVSDVCHAAQHAVFIDNGMMFGGKDCIFRDDKCKAFFYDLDVYKDTWTVQAIEDWKKHLRSIAGTVLHKSYGFMPPSWYDDHHKGVRSTLLDRLESLDRLMEPYMERLFM